MLLGKFHCYFKLIHRSDFNFFEIDNIVLSTEPNWTSFFAIYSETLQIVQYTIRYHRIFAVQFLRGLREIYFTGYKTQKVFYYY